MLTLYVCSSKKKISFITNILSFLLLNVKICQDNNYDYGDQNSVQFGLLDQTKELLMRYSSSNSGLLRKSTILCVCSSDESFEVTSSDQRLTVCFEEFYSKIS
jgi:hypothetical protein